MTRSLQAKVALYRTECLLMPNIRSGQTKCSRMQRRRLGLTPLFSAFDPTEACLD